MANNAEHLFTFICPWLHLFGKVLIQLLGLFFFFSWLRWVFVAVRGLSLVAASGANLHCSARASHWGGFSCCTARALGVWASVVAACRLSSCGVRAQ